MERLTRIKWLLLPSVLSGALTIALAGAILAYACWSYVTHNQLFYEGLFGAYGFLTVLQASPDSTAFIRDSILSSEITYPLLVAGAAVITSLVVYAILEGSRSTINDTTAALTQIHGSSRTATGRDAVKRLLTRIAVLIIWACYSIVCINVLVPVSILLANIAIGQIDASTWSGALYFVPAGLLLAISLHLHVVFARLFFLKLRLFGGMDVELGALDEEAKHEAN